MTSKTEGVPTVASVAPAPGAQSAPHTHARFGITFDQDGAFAALNAATVALEANGFTVGATQRGAPCAVMYGDYTIAKWRNLNHDERRETHATLSGDFRDGPLTFRLLPAAPDEACIAFGTILKALAGSSASAPDASQASGGTQ